MDQKKPLLMSVKGRFFTLMPNMPATRLAGRKKVVMIVSR